MSQDPIRIAFPVTSRELLDVRKRAQDAGTDPRNVKVGARLADGSIYPYDGSIDFLGVEVDPTTDSLTVRAQVPNPEGYLVDGQLVTAIVKAAKPETVLVVPYEAMQIDQSGRFVLTLDAENKVKVQRIETGETYGNNIVVTQGLTEGTPVITIGVQKVRPDMVVEPDRGLARGEPDMISSVFVDRPRLSIVISIVITIAGLIALKAIPLAQFPDIVPPQVQVTASYPGAGAAVVEATVAQPIESQVVGVDNMLYMKSNSGNDGSYSLTVSFAVGSDPDINTVNVQNRVSLAEAKLPDEVKRSGLSVKKKSSALLARHRDLFAGRALRHAVPLQLRHHQHPRQYQARARRRRCLPVRRARIQHADLDRERPAGEPRHGAERHRQRVKRAEHPGGGGPHRLAADDEGPAFSAQYPDARPPRRRRAIRECRGARQSRMDRSCASAISAASSLAPRSSDSYGRFNQAPGALIAVYQAPGANAVDVAARLDAEMDRLAQSFPQGLAYKVTYDTTDFVKESVHEVVKTLLEAFVLVAIVVFLFLGSIRATLIPIIAVPVSLIGTFAVMLALGFSANTVSLLALVLAIGIVVDDAIVVVENVERVLEEEPDLTPKEATKKAMSEITAPIIAITLVLLSVFVPVAFIPGIAGTLYRQFAVAVSVSMVISAINALTLSPALCGVLAESTGTGRGADRCAMCSAPSTARATAMPPSYARSCARPSCRSWSSSRSFSAPPISSASRRAASCQMKIRAPSSSKCRRRRGHPSTAPRQLRTSRTDRRPEVMALPISARSSATASSMGWRNRTAPS